MFVSEQSQAMKRNYIQLRFSIGSPHLHMSLLPVPPSGTVLGVLENIIASYPDVFTTEELRSMFLQEMVLMRSCYKPGHLLHQREIFHGTTKLDFTPSPNHRVVFQAVPKKFEACYVYLNDAARFLLSSPLRCLILYLSPYTKITEVMHHIRRDTGITWEDRRFRLVGNQNNDCRELSPLTIIKEYQRQNQAGNFFYLQARCCPEIMEHFPTRFELRLDLELDDSLYIPSVCVTLRKNTLFYYRRKNLFQKDIQGVISSFDKAQILYHGFNKNHYYFTVRSEERKYGFYSLNREQHAELYNLLVSTGPCLLLTQTYTPEEAAEIKVALSSSFEAPKNPFIEVSPQTNQISAASKEPQREIGDIDQKYSMFLATVDDLKEYKRLWTGENEDGDLEWIFKRLHSVLLAILLQCVCLNRHNYLQSNLSALRDIYSFYCLFSEWLEIQTFDLKEATDDIIGLLADLVFTLTTSYKSFLTQSAYHEHQLLHPKRVKLFEKITSELHRAALSGNLGTVEKPYLQARYQQETTTSAPEQSLQVFAPSQSLQGDTEWMLTFSQSGKEKATKGGSFSDSSSSLENSIQEKIEEEIRLSQRDEISEREG